MRRQIATLSLALASFALAAFVFSAPCLAADTTEEQNEAKKEEQAVATEAENPQKPAEAPLVQIALLLDTSNSMDGLINQAKAHLWKIVNEFALARKDGVQPNLHVALFEYGNSRLPAASGYIRLVTPLTDNLDKVSESLFALTTKGGDEYCGQVIQEAVKLLEWSQDDQQVRCIFIAGNEPFDQGDIDYKKACSEAIKRGITVNTIFCGTEAEGLKTHWKDGALLADGSFVSIDQNASVAAIPTPQDAELAKLNTKINALFLPYGKVAQQRERLSLQEKQDAAVGGFGGGALANRAAAKASGLYAQSNWDLVTAIAQKKVKLEDIPEEELPQVLRDLPADKRLAYVKEKAAERTALEAEIQALCAKRDAYLAEERAKAGAAAAPTLEKAVVDVVRKQAEAKNFKFVPRPTVPVEPKPAP